MRREREGRGAAWVRSERRVWVVRELVGRGIVGVLSRLAVVRLIG